jgi:hypothetical protein
MAFTASSSVDIVTNPNPRLRPVSRSVITWTSVTVPKAENDSRSSSEVARKGRLPT